MKFRNSHVYWLLFALTLCLALILPTLAQDKKLLLGAGGPTTAAFVPTDVANLAFWFKADQIGGTDGDALTTWSDQSGNSRNITQATAAKKPTYKDNGTDNLNGKPVVFFDGTDDWLKTSAEVSWPTAYSVFWVVKTSTGFTAYPMAANGSTTELTFQFDSATLWKVNGTNTSNTNNGQDSATITSGAWTVLSGMVRETTAELYAQGVTGGSTARTGTNNSGNAHLTLGAYDGTFGYLNGYVAEVVVYFADIGATDRQRVEDYLGSKYAITITH